MELKVILRKSAYRCLYRTNISTSQAHLLHNLSHNSMILTVVSHKYHRLAYQFAF